MKPIVVIRHGSYNGPELFADVLAERQIPMHLLRIDEGDVVPKDPALYSGIVLMGGAMSANDDYPWLQDEISLVKSALTANIPVLGHCLGGQILAKALGASIVPSPAVEVGFIELTVVSNRARRWFGEVDRIAFMQWHTESFELPPNTELLLSSDNCPNQAFCVDDLHIGMQFHCEARLAMVEEWMHDSREQVIAFDVPSAHHPDRVIEDARVLLPQAQDVARTLYNRWLLGVVGEVRAAFKN
jgi:GMP synthase-like glutamine amidotransferase